MSSIYIKVCVAITDKLRLDQSKSIKKLRLYLAIPENTGHYPFVTGYDTTIKDIWQGKAH